MILEQLPSDCATDFEDGTNLFVSSSQTFPFNVAVFALLFDLPVAQISTIRSICLESRRETRRKREPVPRRLYQRLHNPLLRASLLRIDVTSLLRYVRRIVFFIRSREARDRLSSLFSSYFELSALVVPLPRIINSPMVQESLRSKVATYHYEQWKLKLAVSLASPIGFYESA